MFVCLDQVVNHEARVLEREAVRGDETSEGLTEHGSHMVWQAK